MEGLEFTLYQVIDGVPTMRDSDIAWLYDKVEAEGLSGTLFHDGSIANKHEFVDYVKTPACIFFLITLTGKPFGFFWLNRIETTHAYCHFVAFPEFWGDGRTVKVGQEAMKICLKEFDTIMGMLPSTNHFAINYLLKVGLHKIGNVPNLMWSEADQKPVEGTMLYITAEDLE
jgi:hypothetical protein